MRDNLRLSLHQEIGHKFETFIKDLLTFSFGLDVQDISNWNSTFDLLVNGRCLEVKVAYPTKRIVKNGAKDRWQFNFASKVGVKEAYYAIIIAIDDSGNEFVYCIPGGNITGPTVQLTSHPNKYTGKYARYLNDFEGLINFIEGDK